MCVRSVRSQKSFRIDPPLLGIIAIAPAFFLGLGALIVVKNGQWGPLNFALGTTVLLYFMLSSFRLKISENGLQYTSLFGSTSVQFGQVSRAYISVARDIKAPQGVAFFWIQQRGAEPLKINIRIFPLHASAMIFSALDAHGVPVHVPGQWAARRMHEQIRAARAKAGI